MFDGSQLPNCQFLASSIQTCQSKGKVVTLSLGGATGAAGFTSDSQASAFADQIWNLFLGGSSSTRPFGDAVLDGYVLRPLVLMPHMVTVAILASTWILRVAQLPISSRSSINYAPISTALQSSKQFAFSAVSLTNCVPQVLHYGSASVSVPGRVHGKVRAPCATEICY